MAEAAAATDAAAAQQLGHYARLQQIEKVRSIAWERESPTGLQRSSDVLCAPNNTMQNVVDAISSAGFAMQELAKEQADIDKHTLHKAVEYFLDQIEVGLNLHHVAQRPQACLGNTLDGPLFPRLSPASSSLCQLRAAGTGMDCAHPRQPTGMLLCRRLRSLCWRPSSLLPLTGTSRPTTTSPCCRSGRAASAVCDSGRGEVPCAALLRCWGRA